MAYALMAINDLLLCPGTFRLVAMLAKQKAAEGEHRKQIPM